MAFQLFTALVEIMVQSERGEAQMLVEKRNRLHTELARLSSERNRLSSARNDLRAELEALGARTTIFVVLGGSQRSNHCNRSARELLALKPLYS